MLSDKAKLKGVEIKEMKDAEKPARPVFTLKPLLKLILKTKAKGVLKEEPKLVKVKSKDQGEAQRDAEIALKVQAELDEEARLERQSQEQASLNYIANLYDEVQARIDADHELTVKWTQEEQKKYTVDERAKLLAYYFENRRIHTSRYQQAQTKQKLLTYFSVLYIKEQERIVDFVPIGFERDERMIEKMNKKAAGVREEKVLEEPDSTKVEVKQEGNKENGRQIELEVLEKRFPIISFESKLYHLDRHGAECIYYRIFRSDESSRWIKTFSEMVTMFDRLENESASEILGVLIIFLVHSETIDEYGSYEDREKIFNKELASPKQTALGKDFSNPLIVDSLLKTIWLSMHHVVTMKHWLFQSKRLLVFKKLKLKKHEVSLNLSRLATTLNWLERSIQIGINTDDEDDEPTPQSKPKEPKPIKETLIPKSYKPKILYPQRLRKEKMEAQYGKFLDIIRAIRINVPLIDVLARMPNYGKFLKELVSNKHKIEQILAAFLSEESFAILQNKVLPKLRDLGSFLIPCNFNKAFSCNALANLGARINLMAYSLYVKLSF
ncbi:hypothetical protein Tco_1351559 [Tanacetum coccineum]